ncbi:MAG: MBL fold metallo-hydrolase [Clostridia bacterium]|nr:MBL fold metallo-hydrolase [Clostridia bacterium]
MKFYKIICCLLCVCLLFLFTACKKDKGDVSDVSSETVSVEVPEKIPDSVQKIAVINGGAPLYKFNDDIYKLDVPTSGIYVSVFFVKDGSKWYIIDTASSGMDVMNYVIPGTRELGIDLEKVKGLVITHRHNLHAGGLSTLAKACPNADIYGITSNFPPENDNTYKITNYVGNNIEYVTIDGHEEQVIGYFDHRTKTLFASDGIQLYGVGDRGCQIKDIDVYLASMNKLKEMDIENIIASHAFSPHGAYAIGTDAVQQYINDGIDLLEELMAFVKKQMSEGVTDVNVIEKRYIKEMSENYADFPTDGFDEVISLIMTHEK